MARASSKFALLLFAICVFMPVPSAQAQRGWVGYGNYCGSSNNGGDPVDRLDEICAIHDACLFKRGLRASPFALLRSNKEAAKKSCKCDFDLVNNMKGYAWNESYYAYAAGWIIQIYANRRIALSCGATAPNANR